MIARERPQVLVVDDEPVMRTISESVLAQHEFVVTAVESAVDALAMISDGYVPDLVLMDVLMPDIDGYEACRRLRAMPELLHMPIIMLTALDDQDSIDRAYHSGATDFITKPINIPLLPHRVRYLLRSAEAFKQLVDSQETLLAAQQIAHLGSWTMDAAGDVVEASGQYLEMVGVDVLPLTGQRLLDRVHREDRPLVSRCRQDMRGGRPYRVDYRIQSDQVSGGWRHVHEMGTPRCDERGDFLGARGILQDISERIAQEQRIRDLAWHDSLTGLNNRDRFIELIERNLMPGGPDGSGAVLLFIHVDGLQAISTVLGQEAADAAIRIVAERLHGLLVEGAPAIGEVAGDCLQTAVLGRYDEQSFALALEAWHGRDDLRAVAVFLHEQLAQPMRLFDEELLIKPYVGIAYYPEDAGDSAELLRRAMLVALKSAREGGVPVAFFDPHHDREASQRMSLERGLRAALDQGGQLQPFFQPKISAMTGAPIGAEVLLRWQHPELGMISPMAFIPLAEEVGLIHPISEWLIAEVCSMIAGWSALGQDVGNISINLSAESFFQTGLIPFIDEVLRRTGVPPTQLIVELTESVLMQNADVANHVIGSLRERGLRVSLDDFGTGFSSLGYLHRFPIDEIKIDRSFVKDLENDHKERALVKAIISLGHALGLKVVAEGVETDSQAALLREMGCDIFQGYLFARPMPAGDFSRYIRAAAERRGQWGTMS